MMIRPMVLMALTVSLGLPLASAETVTVSPVPRFSVEHMDQSVRPAEDFYRFAAGSWLKNNPVPADKARWSGFDELAERNWELIHELLEASATAGKSATGPRRQVGDFYTSAMDTNRIEQLAFKPIEPDLRDIARLKTTRDLVRLLARFHQQGVNPLFGDGVGADAKNSSVYVYEIGQGGLSLPDRDYYLAAGFATQRDAFVKHVEAMFRLLGEPEAQAKRDAATVLNLETELARACKSRVDLRDPNANYNKLTVQELEQLAPSLQWKEYLAASGLGKIQQLVVGQKEFVTALGTLVTSRPLDEWKTYLRWHVVSEASPFLHRAAAEEHFRFYGTQLRGQPQQEPRWQRAAKVIDASIGEALGQLFVEKHFPAAARIRMEEMVANIRTVFQDRLRHLSWMSDATRTKALAKFDRFTQKIGHPEVFRDYSSVVIRRDDYLGNVRRAARFESLREIARVGKAVDRREWHMSPQTVNAYFSPLQNEIVFPAGILQPPFFDVTLDDAVNYGAIGVVIGHEITHGYDDQGRKFDADGNLNDWWTAADAAEFDARAQKVVDQYGAYEALPGLKVNGRLTLGENIADLGGTSIAYEALQRALAKNPERRKTIDGFTPEQRFFLSLAQLWRVTWREAELRRRIVVDPHSPGQFRAIGPHVNLPEFFEAFGIHEGDRMWRPDSERAKIW
jgi:putative endopeptidase